MLYSKSTMTNPCNQFVFNMLQSISIRKIGFVVSTLNAVVHPSYFPYVCGVAACFLSSENIFFFCRNHENTESTILNVWAQVFWYSKIDCRKKQFKSHRLSVCFVNSYIFVEISLLHLLYKYYCFMKSYRKMVDKQFWKDKHDSFHHNEREEKNCVSVFCCWCFFS